MKIPPPCAVPKSREEWEVRTKNTRQRLWSLLGEMPSRPTRIDATLRNREEREGYIVEQWFLDNAAGSQIPATLLIPQNLIRSAPAVLYCHQHGGAYSVGKQELFLTHPVPEAPGEVLVRQGYVVLAVDAPGFGERQGQSSDGEKVKGTQEEWSLAKYYLWQGQTLWGMLLRDDLIGFDFLYAHPDVDSSRIGVTGMSMGSTRSWWLAALEERISCVVGVACLTRYEELIRAEALHAHGIYYFVPQMMRYFDAEAVVSLIAPRPLLLQLSDNDEGSPIEGARRILDYCAAIYAMYGRQDHLDSLVVSGVGHAYTQEMWTRTQAWLQSHLLERERDSNAS